MVCIFKFVIIFLNIQLISSVSFSVMDALHRNLTSGHNKYVRPEADLDSPTCIRLDLNLVNLQGINEVEGTVSISGYFTVQWTDVNMKWNPSNFDGAEHINLPGELIWIPTLINSNTAIEFKTFDSGFPDSVVQVAYNGSIVWTPGVNFVFACNMDIRYFPFDTQECEIEIIPWGFKHGSIMFSTTSSITHSVSYTESSEWKLETTSSDVNNIGMPTVKYKVIYKRRSVFLLVNLILPIVTLAVLNICVFCLPQESGERVGFAITLLLAVIVFLTIAQGMLPATAEPRLSDISIMLLADLIISVMIVGSVIFSSYLYYKSDDDVVPDWIQATLSCNIRSRSDQRNLVHVANDNSKQIQSTDNSELNTVTKWSEQLTWQEVAKFWDKISFHFFTLLLIIGIMSYVIDVEIGNK